MLLQIKQRIDEKRKIKEEKDNISLSSGKSIKPKLKVLGDEECFLPIYLLFLLRM